MVTGVGGTGVVTIGALLGMAAHIEDMGVCIVDQLGFAQKGGSVVTHVRLAKDQDQIHASRVNSGMADAFSPATCWWPAATRCWTRWTRHAPGR